jgi:hypothetical protein
MVFGQHLLEPMKISPKVSNHWREPALFLLGNYRKGPTKGSLVATVLWGLFSIVFWQPAVTFYPTFLVTQKGGSHQQLFRGRRNDLRFI